MSKIESFLESQFYAIFIIYFKTVHRVWSMKNTCIFKKLPNSLSILQNTWNNYYHPCRFIIQFNFFDPPDWVVGIQERLPYCFRHTYR